MSASPDARFRELVSRHLDGALTPAEEADLLALLDDPGRRAAFRDLCRVGRELAGLLEPDPPTPDAVMIARVMTDIAAGPAAPAGPVRGGRRRRATLVRWVGIAAGVAAAVFVCAWLAWPTAGPPPTNKPVEGPPVAVVREVRGEAFLVAHGAQTPVGVGQAVAAGQGVATGGKDSRLVVEYPDGTRLELGPDTELASLAEVDPVGPRKRVVVAQGALTVDAAEQPPRRPLTLVTPQAEVFVTGNRLAVRAGEEGTEVRAIEGAVRVRRPADPGAVEVQPGATAVAAADTDRGIHTTAPAPDDKRTLAAGLGTILDLPGVNTLTFTRDGTRLAAGTSAGARLWPMSAAGLGEPVEVSGLPRAVFAAAFSPAGDVLATAGADPAVHLVHLADGVRTVYLHQRQVRAVAFSPDGKWLAAGGIDGVLRLRDPATGEERAAYTEVSRSAGGEPGPAATANPGGAVRPAASVRGGWGVTGVAFSPDSRLVAVGLSDKQVRVRAVASGELVHALAGHTDGVRSVAFSPDGALLASASGREVIVWATGTGRPVWSAPHAAPVAFSPDGRLLAVGWMNPALVDARTGKTVARITDHRGPVNAVAFQPGRSRLALGGWRGITLLDLPADLIPAPPTPLPK